MTTTVRTGTQTTHTTTTPDTIPGPATVIMIAIKSETTTGIMIGIGTNEVIAIADNHSPAEREGPPKLGGLFCFAVVSKVSSR